MLLYTLAGLYAFLAIFYLLYILVMGIYRAHLNKQLKWFHWVFGAWAAVLVGLVFDVVANVFVAPFFFRQRPYEWLVTTRLKRYLNNPETHIHNKILAQWVCSELLDLFDPNGRHC
jgi:multisubunit Na+/H+ antiporter MnhB subunit